MGRNKIELLERKLIKIEDLQASKLKLLEENAELVNRKTQISKKLNRLKSVMNDCSHSHILEVDRVQREYNQIQAKISELTVKFSDINNKILSLRSVENAK